MKRPTNFLNLEQEKDRIKHNILPLSLILLLIITIRGLPVDSQTTSFCLFFKLINHPKKLQIDRLKLLIFNFDGLVMLSQESTWKFI